MADMTLLLSQRNEIFDMIQLAGLDPRHFSWSIVDSMFDTGDIGFSVSVSRLEYQETGYFYIFDFKDGKHFASFAPGSGLRQEMRYPGSWPLQKEYLQEWLRFVNRELVQEDLWTRLSASDALPEADAIEELPNTEIPACEVQAVKAAINHAVGYLAQLDELKEGQERISAELDYLRRAVDRQGKRDFLYLCVGVLTTLMTSLGISPEHIRVVWLWLVNALRGVTQFPPAPG